MPLRAAVAGTGFGTRICVPALRQAGVDVVGLVARNAERTAVMAAKLARGRCGGRTRLGTFISYTPDGADPSAPRPAWW
jgi:hypothetical protein